MKYVKVETILPSNLIEEIIPSEDFLLAGESYGGYLSRGIMYK